MALEPHVCDAPAISWEVIKTIQTIEVVDRYAGNRLWLGQPKVDRNTPLPLRGLLLAAPEGYAAAGRAEVKLHTVAANVGFGWPGDMDPFPLEIVDPQHAVTAAHRAIACGSTLRQGVVCPVPANGSAVTGAMQHVCPLN
jgi:hypothetical protein